MFKLAVSNIAWVDDHHQFFDLLSKLGVSGVEVAPGKIANWECLTSKMMHSYRAECEDFGLSIPSFQAFLFGKPKLQLLGEKKIFQAMLEHIDFVARLAAIAGAKILVYGAPKSRLLLGHSLGDAKKLALERLALLAEVCWNYGVSIGLEAVPSAYSGEFITSYNESLYFVEKVKHPGLVLHLDTGCTFLNNESITEAINKAMLVSKISHFHISQPQLSHFDSPESYHNVASLALKKEKYSNWHCIEMKNTCNPINDIVQAIKFAVQVYN